MQIPRVGFLSLLSFVSLVSWSFGSLRPIHCEKASDSPDQVSLQEHEYDYVPTDYYHIYNTDLQHDVTYDENAHGDQVFLKARTGSDTQLWKIQPAPGHHAEYTIRNTRTENYLTAIGVGETVQGNKRVPEDPHVRWIFHAVKARSASTQGPFTIESVQFPKNYLGSSFEAVSEFVKVDALKEGRHQVWFLQD